MKRKKKGIKVNYGLLAIVGLIALAIYLLSRKKLEITLAKKALEEPAYTGSYPGGLHTISG